MLETTRKQQNVYIIICLLIINLACNSTNMDTARKTGQISRAKGSLDERDHHDGQSSSEGVPEGHLADLFKQADLIEGSSAASDFASLTFQILAKRFVSGDLALTSDNGELIGHCLIFAAGDPPFTTEDIKDLGQVMLSPGRRIVATRSKDIRPKDCEESFRALMPERFNKDFFNLHVSIYGVKQGEN